MKILRQMFCQKRIVSNVILAFLDHLKARMVFRRPTMVADIQRPLPFQNLWIRPCFKNEADEADLRL